MAAFLLLIFDETIAQNALISEEQKIIETYPFGDPSPIPVLAQNKGHIYPYFSFNEYSRESTGKEWKTVQLENNYLKLSILPEVGGKIRGAVEKSTGKEFIYQNEVMKFRNIALRGPWTSGGIEFNFGITGHAPTTSTPVDYLVRENEDGSVSCIIGALDLPSRTEWRVTVTLPKDKAYFKTESFWYNPTLSDQSYYVWMNAAVKTADDLQFFFPGQYYIGHSGDLHSWPVDSLGRDLSHYRNNDFGSNKSYHILGERTEFYGGYWHDEDFGFGNWSLYSDMPGKKLWIWSLSRSGAIWEDLLTDAGGQYAEVQSGRQFSQANSASNRTPFGRAAFHPSAADSWEELWFPVLKTGGISAASPHGVLHVDHDGEETVIGLMGLQALNDELKISAGEKLIKKRALSLDPLEVIRDTLDLSPGAENLQITVGKNKLVYNSRKDRDDFDRPLENHRSAREPAEPATGQLYQTAKNRVNSRNYSGALKTFSAILEKDSAFTASYVGLADLYYRRGEYRKALEKVKRALSHNTYNPDANFVHGVIKARTGNPGQALESFGWAARSLKYRSAAFGAMAEIHLESGRFAKAIEFAGRALDFNRHNINAYKVLAVSFRKQGKTERAQSILNQISDIDPLSHFARFERYLLQLTAESLHDFTSLIRNELPHETYLELALFYANNGLEDEAVTLLEEAPDHPMVHYWLGWLQKERAPEESRHYLSRASGASPHFVFPFRPESIPVLEWARQFKPSWKTDYYLGLIYWHLDRTEKAGRLFDRLRQTPDYAPFYLTRGKLRSELKQADSRIRKDFLRARELNAGDWRTWHAVNEFYLDTGARKAALENSEKAHGRFSDNDAIEMDYAKSLLFNGKYEEAVSLLEQMHILPFEGAKEGHDIFEQANILAALEKMKRGDFKTALQYVDNSRSWPENLGVGKPYNPDLRLQNYLAATIYLQLGENGPAEKLLAEIQTYTERHPENRGPGYYTGILALRKMGYAGKAEKLLNSWQNAQPDRPLVHWAAAHFKEDSKNARRLYKRIREDNPEALNSFLLLTEVIHTVQQTD